MPCRAPTIWDHSVRAPATPAGCSGRHRPAPDARIHPTDGGGHGSYESHAACNDACSGSAFRYMEWALRGSRKACGGGGWRALAPSVANICSPSLWYCLAAVLCNGKQRPTSCSKSTTTVVAAAPVGGRK
eukprot:3625526-Prymnesium_polylepis.1